MAPQEQIPITATVLGTIGTVLWCVQLVPQVWANWRTQNTEGLPALMMLIWAICGMPFGAYCIIQNFNIPIQVQPHVFMGLCLITWAQILVYSYKWRWWTSAMLTAAMATTFAGIEAALILTLRPIYNAGNEIPPLVVGIIASTLLAAGLLPPYFEIWKRKGRVIGINWLFLSIDCLGAIFSLMALVAQDSFDVLGGVLYILCACLEIGIFISHFIWLLRTRQIRQEAKSRGKTFNELAADYEQQGIPFKFSERKPRRDT